MLVCADYSADVYNITDTGKLVNYTLCKQNIILLIYEIFPVDEIQQ